MAVVSLACAFTGNFSQMFVCRLIQGIGVGGEMRLRPPTSMSCRARMGAAGSSCCMN